MQNREANANPGQSILNIDTAHLHAVLQEHLEVAIAELDGNAPLLPRMARFHMGWADSSGEPTDPDTRRIVQGKRIRPFLAMLTCAALGGSVRSAAPLAAAIELLHNFTLIHDDIQDRSPNRRHRATVWRIWGDAQAINAGDALFAAAQLSILRTPPDTVEPDVLLELIAELNRVTIEIVRGQVLDLGFEGRDDVTPDDYMTMIGGKTAAIVRYAAWAGGRIAGASPDVAERLGHLGEALGISFQIRDDMLGIWGADGETGKSAGDDIRRRKQSLPVLLLRSHATEADAQTLQNLYSAEEIDDEGVATVIDMLDRYAIRESMTEHAQAAHDQAMEALESVLNQSEPETFNALSTLVEQLRTRLS